MSHSTISPPSIGGLAISASTGRAPTSATPASPTPFQEAGFSPSLVRSQVTNEQQAHFEAAAYQTGLDAAVQAEHRAARKRGRGLTEGEARQLVEERIAALGIEAVMPSFARIVARRKQ